MNHPNIRWRFPALLPATLALLTLIHPARAVTLTDAFTRFDPALWSASYEGSGPLFRIAESRLVATVPAHSTGETFKAKATTLFAVSGDFDARVEYHLLNWSPGNGMKVSLGADEVGSVQRVSDSDEGGEVWLTHFATDGVNGKTSTRALSGRLRLVRRGDRLSGYAFRAGRWVLIHTAERCSGEDARLSLSVWSHGGAFAGKPVRVAFDNFSLRYLNRSPAPSKAGP